MSINGKKSVEMPVAGSSVKFTNYHKQLQVPFVIYADFEAILKKTNKSSCSGKTYKFQKHVDCGYGYKLVCTYNDAYSRPVRTYRGPNAVTKFLEKMLELADYCRLVKTSIFNKELSMSPENERDFMTQTRCHICGVMYKKEEVVVATGKYRGSAHQLCNRNFRMTNKIP